MSLVPTREQREHAEDMLRLVGEINREHQAEKEVLLNRIHELEVQLAARQPLFPAEMHGKPVTAPVSEFNYDMDTAPKGGKLIVLNHGGVATFAILSDRNNKDFQAWAPMPKIRKDKR